MCVFGGRREEGSRGPKLHSGLLGADTHSVECRRVAKCHDFWLSADDFVYLMSAVTSATDTLDAWRASWTGARFAFVLGPLAQT